MQRLKTRSQFEAVMRGQPVARGPHFALHRLVLGPDQQSLFTSLQPGARGPWIGVLLPKRLARRAVTRQLLRRQVDRAARQLAAGIPATDAVAYVVRLRQGFARSEFHSAASRVLKAAAYSEIAQLLHQATGERS